MPELPEVESVRLSLLPHLPGQVVASVEVRHPRVLVYPQPEAFERQLLGERFEQLERRGKLLIFRLQRHVLMVHLGMTGQLTCRHPNRADRPFQRHPVTGLQRTLQHPVDAHTHISLWLENGSALHYRDIRKFGKWRLYRLEESAWQEQLQRLGEDPLSASWDDELFIRQVRQSQRPIKAILLDQKVASGVGNIYADEALFLAGIRPQARGHRLSRARLQRLSQAIPQVLRQGLANGGTSFSDYVNADGQAGQNQEKLWVYGRYGQACLRCQGVLEKAVVAQRTSTWCRHCQR